MRIRSTDLETGDMFSYLKVIAQAESDPAGKKVYKCLCTKCGNHKNVRGTELRSGLVQSCGCLASEILSERNEKARRNAKPGRQAVAPRKSSDSPNDLCAIAKISPNRLKSTRENAGLTQLQMAQRIGLPHHNRIILWETGRAVPSGDYLLRWMIACSCSPSDLAEPI